MLGMVLGVVVLRYLHDDSIKMCTGICLLSLAAAHFLLRSRPSLPQVVHEADKGGNWRGAWLHGLLIGTFTVMANVAGPVAVMYFLQLGMSKMQINGTRSWLFVLTNSIKIPVQLLLGNIQLADALLVCPLALVAVLSTLLAAVLLVPHVQQDTFERAAWLLVVVGALSLVMRP